MFEILEAIISDLQAEHGLDLVDTIWGYKAPDGMGNYITIEVIRSGFLRIEKYDVDNGFCWLRDFELADTYEFERAIKIILQEAR